MALARMVAYLRVIRPSEVHRTYALKRRERTETLRCILRQAPQHGEMLVECVRPRPRCAAFRHLTRLEFRDLEILGPAGARILGRVTPVQAPPVGHDQD